MKKNIVLTGVTGQASSIFIKYLLDNTDYNLIGVVRRTSNPNYVNIEKFFNEERFKIVSGDITDHSSIASIVKEYKPDYFIHAAAQSDVAESWRTPLSTLDINIQGVANCLEAVRLHHPECRFVTFSSSEMFGDNEKGVIDINSPLRAKSPYGASKIGAHQVVKTYRESYGMYAVGAIMFNYEGTNRAKKFVTRKITSEVARIKTALTKGESHTPAPMYLGNINSKRDWSDCEDIVDGVWRMLNRTEGPKDYVISSGEVHTVREFIEEAFKAVGIEGGWVGEGIDEKFLSFHHGLSIRGPITLVKISEEFYRPNELGYLLGDSTPIREELGWEPKTSFKELLDKMVKHDMMLLENA
tara:strand:- start:13514 stop:14581 length:1068 start_codon:yes stop_codon:yes gene_type:complete